MISVQNLLAPFCFVLGKSILRHFPLLVGLGKQFYTTVLSLLKFKRTAISWHLLKQIGVIAYPMYYRLRRFPASQEDKYGYEIKINNKKQQQQH